MEGGEIRDQFNNRRWKSMARWMKRDPSWELRIEMDGEYQYLHIGEVTVAWSGDKNSANGEGRTGSVLEGREGEVFAW